MSSTSSSRFNGNSSTPLKQLDERDELVSGLVAKNLGYSSLNKVDYLRRMDSNHSSQCSDMVGGASSGIGPISSNTGTGVVKSVKFKDPPENVNY